jgi:hypothetical protein
MGAADAGAPDNAIPVTAIAAAKGNVLIGRRMYFLLRFAVA